METLPLFRLENIHKNYYPAAGPLPVLKGINLTINKGESLAIMGPSGSGKSTLLKILAALEPIDKGEILNDQNRSLTSFNQQELTTFRLNTIGIIFQDHRLLPQCTAMENILLPTLPLKTPPEEARTAAEKLLSQMNLNHRASHFPHELSGGECQRVAIARALINNPSLILADEPTGSLDNDTALKTLEVLTPLIKPERSLVLVTHSPLVAEQMQSTYELKNGLLNH